MITAQRVTVQSGVPAAIDCLANRPKPVAGLKTVGWHFGFLSVSLRARGWWCDGR